MSEQNKTLELKEEDLEKASGGFSSSNETIYNFDEGDCFQMYDHGDLLQVIVKYPYQNAFGTTEISCRRRISYSSMIELNVTYTANSAIFNINNYQGNNVFDF